MYDLSLGFFVNGADHVDLYKCSYVKVFCSNVCVVYEAPWRHSGYVGETGGKCCGRESGGEIWIKYQGGLLARACPAEYRNNSLSELNQRMVNKMHFSYGDYDWI